MKDFLRATVEALRPQPGTTLDCRGELYLNIAEAALAAYEQPEKAVWRGGATPPELLSFFDLRPVMIEILIGLLTITGNASEAIDEGAKHASNDGCGFHRGAIGGILNGTLPVPKLLVGCCGNICIGSNKLFHVISDLYDVPFLSIYVPPGHSKKNVEYVARQMEAVVKKLEGITSSRLTDSKIKEVFDNSNRTRANLLKISELRKHVPSPYRGHRIQALTALFGFVAGTRDSVRISSGLADEIAENVRKKDFPVQPEKYRLFWMNVAPGYPTPIFDWLENKMKASIVIDEYSLVEWQPYDWRDPFRSLAERCYTYLNMGPASMRAERLAEEIRDFRIDGVIHFANWGCRIINGPMLILKKHFNEKGYPFLNIDGDLADSRNFSFEPLKNRIEAFLESLGNG